MATFQIFTVPIGSQFVSSISGDDSANKNDFVCYIVASENVSNFAQSALTLSKGSIQKIEGKNSVYAVTVRPEVPTPQSETITLTIAANAVTEGNPTTTATIRISRVFPDADAEAPTTLFTHGFNSNALGIAVTPTRILILRSSPTATLYQWTHTGVEQVAERKTGSVQNISVLRMDFVNALLYVTNVQNRRVYVYDLDLAQYQLLASERLSSITHTRLGITGVDSSSPTSIRYYPYGKTGTVDTPIGFNTQGGLNIIAHTQDLLFVKVGLNFLILLEIDADTHIQFRKRLNIAKNTSELDAFIYQDTYYRLDNTKVQTLDIKKYRPLAKNTKFNIHPVILPYLPNTPTQTIGLKQFSPDAERIVWDVGFDLPNWVSIDAQSRLQVTPGTLTAGEVKSCLLKFRGINRIDSHPFSFYLVVVDRSPRWKNLERLTLKANTAFDLFGIVENATRIEVHPDHPLPAGATLMSGVFTPGTVGGQVAFRAYNDVSRQFTDSDGVSGTF